MFYREASGAFVVFDLTTENDKTLLCAPEWKRDLDLNLGHSIPTVLLGNKCDKPHPPKDPAFMDEFVKQHGFDRYFETSAKTDKNLSEAVKFLVDRIIESGVLPEETEDSDLIDPAQTDTRERPRGGCICS